MGQLTRISEDSPVCILGMHRSGTSLVTRLLHLCGLYLGPQERIMPASDENPAGYWENLDFVDLNENLLQELGGTWDDPPIIKPGWHKQRSFDDYRIKTLKIAEELNVQSPWGWKDPRNSLVFEFYESIFPQLKPVICLRNPIEVAHSLDQRNDNVDYQQGLRLWLTYSRELKRILERRDCIVTHYEAYFYDASEELQRVLNFLDIDLDDHTIRKAVQEVSLPLRESFLPLFISQELSLEEEIQHDYDFWIEHSGPIFLQSIQDKAYQERLVVSSFPRTISKLIEARRQIAKLNRELQALRREREVIVNDLQHLEVNLVHTQQKYSMMQRTFGGRLTLAYWEILNRLFPAGSIKRARAKRIRDWINNIGFSLETWKLRGFSIRRMISQRKSADINSSSLFPESESVQHSVSDVEYAEFVRNFEPKLPELRLQTEEFNNWSIKPTFGIVTGLEEISVDTFRETTACVFSQTYQEWVWVIVTYQNLDEEVLRYIQGLAGRDSRINVIRGSDVSDHSRNLNRGLRAISQDYVVVLNSGDTLAPHALYTVASEIIQHNDVDFFYSDFDYINETGFRRAPFFKPDWSPELMLSINLLKHLSVFKRTLLEQVEYINPDLNGAYYWDLFIKISELPVKIAHIPQILYHVRQPTQTADSHSTDGYQHRIALQTVLLNHLRRIGMRFPNVQIHPLRSPRLSWESLDERRVSIIIPSKDKAQILQRCLVSIFSKTTYENYEVIVVDTGSLDADTQRLYERQGLNPRFRVIDYHQPFNFSEACNFGASVADGDLFLFLNNDTEILDRNWLQRLTQWFEMKDVAIVGAKLLYPDGRLQHVGVIVGMGGLASHIFEGHEENVASIFGSDNWYRNYSAVTGACLLISREVFDQVGKFDEKFILNFSDVDLCLKARESGYRIVLSPDVKILHHESLTHSRRIPRGDFERASIKWSKWHTFDGDPYFNSNLSYMNPFPSYKTSSRDNPSRLNKDLLKRLPNKEIIVLPEDLD